MSNINLKNKKPKITINTIIIAVLLITVSVLTYKLIIINDLYNDLIDNQENINDDIENNEIAKNNEIENTKENKLEDEIGDNYYYFSILDENNNILYKTNYFNNDNIFSSKLLPKKMVFHLIEGDNEYTSSFNNGDVKEKVVTNVVKDVITDVITKTETVNITTDATVTYIGVGNTTQTINIPSGTTINFNAGEHGLYDSVPSSMTLSDKQQLAITDTIYVPNKIEVNYKFDGFSYSGNTFYANYSYLGNMSNILTKRTQVSYTDINNVVYLPLDYLESSGTQCIDLGFQVQLNRKVEVDFQYNSGYAPAEVVFGCRDGATNRRFDCYTGPSANELVFRTTTVGEDNLKSIDLSKRNVISLKFDNTKQYVNINGATSNINKPAQTFGNSNIYLFNRSSQSSDSAAFMKGKIYRAKIYDGDDLKADFIPVQRVNDKILGMINLSNSTFYTNSGSGTFNGNTLIENDQYVGKIYISNVIGSQLTLIANSNNGFEFVCWNDGTTDNPKTITYNNTDSYYAIFKPIS